VVVSLEANGPSHRPNGFASLLFEERPRREQVSHPAAEQVSFEQHL